MDFSRFHDLSFFYADHLVIFDADEVLRPRMRSSFFWVLILHARVVYQEHVVLLLLYFLAVSALLD